MIFTRLYIDNLYSFKEAELDLTFDKKPKYSTLEYEYLEERPKFNYKKVCILSGANASGKTSLGRLMNWLQFFIQMKIIRQDEIGQKLNDKAKLGILECEFVTKVMAQQRNQKDKFIAHKLHLEFNEFELVNLKYASVTIGINNSNRTVRNKLNKAYEAPDCIDGFGENKIFALEHFSKIKMGTMGWYYMFSENIEKDSNLKPDDHLLSPKRMFNILNTFDPTIIEVKGSYTLTEDNSKESKNKNSEKSIRSKDMKLNGFSIIFINGEELLIDLEGGLTNKERLSKGTYDAIKVTAFISRILKDKKTENSTLGFGNTYFLDEKLAYSHSELELEIINLIIEKLPRCAQFFYTTHNRDIFNLHLPIHSFSLLKKDEEGAIFIDPKLTFKKNDRSFKNYIDNDYFLTNPDLSKLAELLNEE